MGRGGATSGGRRAPDPHAPTPDDRLITRRQAVSLGVGVGVVSTAAGAATFAFASSATRPTKTVWQLASRWDTPRGPHGKTALQSRASQLAAANRYALTEPDAIAMNLHRGSWAPAVPIEVDERTFERLWSELSYEWHNPWNGATVRLLDARHERGADLSPVPEPTVVTRTDPSATPTPTAQPTPTATTPPIVDPDPTPTAEPTAEPTTQPTAQPTAGPTTGPTTSPQPDPAIPTPPTAGGTGQHPAAPTPRPDRPGAAGAAAVATPTTVPAPSTDPSTAPASTPPPVTIELDADQGSLDARSAVRDGSSDDAAIGVDRSAGTLGGGGDLSLDTPSIVDLSDAQRTSLRDARAAATAAGRPTWVVSTPAAAGSQTAGSSAPSLAGLGGGAAGFAAAAAGIAVIIRRRQMMDPRSGKRGAGRA